MRRCCSRCSSMFVFVPNHRTMAPEALRWGTARARVPGILAAAQLEAKLDLVGLTRRERVGPSLSTRERQIVGVHDALPAVGEKRLTVSPRWRAVCSVTWSRCPSGSAVKICTGMVSARKW